MIKQNKLKSNKKLIKALVILFVLSMLVVISGINKPHLSPFKISLETDSIVASNFEDEDHGLIVDSLSKRLLILNSNQELIRVIDFTASGSYIEKATDALICNDKLYIIGTTSFNSGEYISAEKFIELDLKGNVKQVIAQKQYSETDYITSASYKDISYGDNCLYVTEANENECSLYRYDPDNYESELIAEFTTDGQIYGALYVPESDTVEAITLLQDRYSYDVNSGCLSSEYSYVSEFDVQGDDMTIRYSVWLAVYNIIFWICLVYFAAVVLFGLYMLLVKKLGKKGRISIAIIILLLLTAAFYTRSSYQTIDNQYRERLRTQSIQLSNMIGSQYDEFEINDYEPIRAALKEFCEANGTDFSVYARLYINKDSKYYTFATSDDRRLSGVEVDDETLNKLESLKSSGQDFFSYSAKFDTKLFAFEYVVNDAGDTIAIVEVCCSEYMLKKDHWNYAINLFINLLAICIAIFVSISAFKALYNDGKLFRKLSKNKDPGRGFVLNGYFQFIFKLMTSMDLAIQVYVAQSLCTGYSEAEQALMIAIPTSAFSVGLWIGTLLCPILVNKFGNRASSVLGCIGSIASYGASILSLLNGSIVLYSISKLLAGIFAQGVLFIVGDSITFMIKDSGERSQAITSAQQSTSAATIIATLAGGYIAQYLSYSTIYLVSGIFAIILLAISLLIFSKSSEINRTAASKTKTAASWKLFLKPVMLMYILCFMLPKLLIGGYNTYLFPLYSSTAGISAVLLSNLSAFSRTFSYLINVPLNKFVSRYDSTKSSVVVALIICASFVAFILSPNIWWAIIVTFIGAALNTIVTKGNKVYIADRAEEFGLEPSKVRSNSIIIEDGIGIFKTPILSTVVSLGYNFACVALGAVCGVLFGIFGLYNKKRNKKTE